VLLSNKNGVFYGMARNAGIVGDAIEKIEEEDKLTSF
jgi:hypothetical protein